MEDQIKQIRERLAKQLGFEIVRKTPERESLLDEGSFEIVWFDGQQNETVIDTEFKLWNALLAAEAKLEAERWREIAQAKLEELGKFFLVTGINQVDNTTRYYVTAILMYDGFYEGFHNKLSGVTHYKPIAPPEGQ